MNAGQTLRLKVRRYAKHSLGWDDEPHQLPGSRSTVARWIRQRLSDLLIHNFLDMALRYHPVVEHLRDQLGPASRVLEVGSGPVGITPYLRRQVIGTDLTFRGPRSNWLIPCKADLLSLPFPDAAFDSVICVDVLEHIHPSARTAALAELLRTTRSIAVVATPCGTASERYDRMVDAAIRRRVGLGDGFLTEHIEYGLPRIEEVVDSIEQAASRQGRPIRLRVIPNVSLPAWYFVQMGKVSLILRAIYILIFPILFPVLRHVNAGACYRQIVFVEMDT